jgi:hypothetical protein
MMTATVLERTKNRTAPAARRAWMTSFTPILADLRAAMLDRSPEQLAAMTGASWDAAVGEFRFCWLDTPYRLTWPALVAYLAAGGEPCTPNLQGLFLYYFSRANGAPAAERWISFRELPDGWLYHQAFQSYTGDRLIQAVGEDLCKLSGAAEVLGGTPLGLGDCSHAFQVLPRVRLAVTYWRGDEDFAPQAQVLFDAAASNYLPTDGLALLGSNLVRRLLTTPCE